jgi:hypothetical protein
MRSVQAGFEPVAIDHAFENPIVARQVGKARDPLCAAHIDSEAGRRHLTARGGSPPERFSICVYRIGGSEIG